jgi:trk system potassium uptake protein TrkA
VKRFAILGLGNFGSHLARSLAQAGVDVLAVDMDEDAVADIKDYVTHAVVASASDKKTLLSLDIDKFDCASVSLGDDVGASILVSQFLKKVGVKEILVKAISEDHAEALENVGATMVVFPEKDTAIKIASTLLTPNLIDYIPVTTGHSIVEIKPPSKHVGKTLAELQIRRHYGLQVLAIKTQEDKGSQDQDDTIAIPDGTFRIESHHILIIMGENKNIDKFRRLS